MATKYDTWTSIEIEYGRVWTLRMVPYQGAPAWVYERLWKFGFVNAQAKSWTVDIRTQDLKTCADPRYTCSLILKGDQTKSNLYGILVFKRALQATDPASCSIKKNETTSQRRIHPTW